MLTAGAAVLDRFISMVSQQGRDFGGAWAIGQNVRYWHKADMASALHMSAFGGKADMTFCAARFCF